MIERLLSKIAASRYWLNWKLCELRTRLGRSPCGSCGISPGDPELGGWCQKCWDGVFYKYQEDVLKGVRHDRDWNSKGHKSRAGKH